jgi:hypothetical protein
MPLKSILFESYAAHHFSPRLSAQICEDSGILEIGRAAGF